MSRLAKFAVLALLLAGAATACGSSSETPITPGTTAALNPTDGSASTTVAPASNSEEGIPANPGSVSEQRPPSGS